MRWCYWLNCVPLQINMVKFWIPVTKNVTLFGNKVTADILVFPSGSVIKNPPAMQETQVQSLGWEDPLEKEMATHSSIISILSRCIS